MSRKVYGKYYYGHKISDYGLENNRVDYGTLAKAFDGVLNNDIYGKLIELGYMWEPYCGSEYYYEDSEGNTYDSTERDERIEELEQEREELESEMENLDEYSDRYSEIEEGIREIEQDIEYLNEEHYHDIFQYYIISDEGARILSEDTDEIVLYNEEFDINLWCVTHYGTAWDYVLTDIECNAGERAFDNESEDD